jgi:16S rRNA (adenine1518-N6/adenine1519-N6)-dimethyltransferase
MIIPLSEGSMNRVFPKKKLGQHFLKDNAVAGRIVNSLTGIGYSSVLEIGPGTGMLTRHLVNRKFDDFRVIEIDNEAVHHLRGNFPDLKEIIRGDFLKMDIDATFTGNLAIIGNFPYNVSSQIMFKVLRHKDKIQEVCGMFQKEVAERICSSPGSKTYGILSVLLQAYYNAEYLFSVPGNLFIPPPKVKSGVVRLRRNEVISLGCDEKLFFSVVKATFGTRRKILRNSVRSAFNTGNEEFENQGSRPEELSVGQFVALTNWIKVNMKLTE